MRRAPVLVGIAALGSMLVWAAESWRNKQASEWTPTDVTKILSNSPWAHEVTVTMGAGSGGMGGRRGGGEWGESGGGMGGGRMGGGGGGMGGGGMGGGGMGGGGGRGGRGGEGGDMGPAMGSMPLLKASVQWLSATPIQDALARRAGKSRADNAPVSGYVIAVSGLLNTVGRGRTEHDTGDSDRVERLRAGTSLTRKGKDPIAPEKVERVNDGSTVLFAFPKSDPITLEDREVEFVTHLGPMELKHKFKLKDMVYQGKLEL